jgi:hypothetical protein
MSLRYKALVAVLLLVALVTGSLGYYVSELYRDAEIRRIRSELERDSRHLNHELVSASTVTRAVLDSAAHTTEVIALFSDPRFAELKDNLDAPAREWQSATNADYVLAALDTLNAQDRKAAILKQRPELSIVSLVRAPALKADPSMRAAILSDAKLYDLLKACFDQPDEKDADGKAKPKGSMSQVLALAGRVFLVVVTPVYDSLHDYTLIGVGSALIELSSQWTRQHRVQADDAENHIEQVILAGSVPTASTLKDPALARPVAAALGRRACVHCRVGCGTGRRDVCLQALGL